MVSFSQRSATVGAPYVFISVFVHRGQGGACRVFENARLKGGMGRSTGITALLSGDSFLLLALCYIRLISNYSRRGSYPICLHSVHSSRGCRSSDHVFLHALSRRSAPEPPRNRYSFLTADFSSAVAARPPIIFIIFWRRSHGRYLLFVYVVRLLANLIDIFPHNVCNNASRLLPPISHLGGSWLDIPLIWCHIRTIGRVSAVFIERFSTRPFPDHSSFNLVVLKC